MSRRPLRRLLPPGAEFKIGRRPPRLVPAAERLVRRLATALRPAGEGTRPAAERTERAVDVLVVGGGIAGLAAAEAAAAAGLTVLLAERSVRLGGIADGYDDVVDGTALAAWVDGRVTALRTSERVTILAGATAAQLHDGVALLLEGARLWRVTARAVVLATGAAEKPLLFPGNDRPGVMLAGAARLALRRRGTRPGRRVVVAAACDEGFRAALDLVGAGVAVERIVDLRLDPESALAYVVRSHGIRMAFGSGPVAVESVRGGLAGVTVANRFMVDGVALRQTIACDALLVSGGFSPRLRLAAQAGARLAFDAALGDFAVVERPDRLFVAGAAAGCSSLAAALDDGWFAGAAAAASLGRAPPPAPARAVSVVADAAPEPVPFLPDPATPAEEAAAVVDRANGVSLRDLAVALHEGFRSPRQLARYARLGRGGADAATAAVTAAAMARLGAAPGTPDGWAEAALIPIPLAALAAVPTTPAAAAPRAFPRPDEAVETAIRREVAASRATAGLADLSARGRFVVSGPGARAFLDRLLATDLAALAPGSALAVLALDPFGFVHAAGELARFADDRFVLNVAPEVAARWRAWLDRWAADWDEGALAVVEETACWAAALLSGPATAELLHELADDPGSRPESGLLWRGHIGGGEAWAVPHATTGDPAVEIVVAAAAHTELWRRLAPRVTAAGGAIIGAGACERLRLEAGTPDPARDGTGVTTAADLGLAALVAPEKGDFIGREALARPALLSSDRRRLMGLLPEGQMAPGPGTLLLAEPAGAVVGHVTRSGYAPSAGRPVGLGLLAGGLARIGERVAFRLSGEWRWAAVAPAPRIGLPSR